MREDQAKEKWCPVGKVREIHFYGGASMTETKGKCIASECMMWRWTQGPMPIPVSNHPIPGEGYCGLAGHRDLGNDLP